MSPVTFAPGTKDEKGTEKLFKSMLGKVYTVHGFDRYGNVALHPKRFERVWVEAEFLKLRVRKKTEHLRKQPIARAARDDSPSRFALREELGGFEKFVRDRGPVGIAYGDH
jgi:hypothetical protein